MAAQFESVIIVVVYSFVCPGCPDAAEVGVCVCLCVEEKERGGG